MQMYTLPVKLATAIYPNEESLWCHKCSGQSGS